MMRVCGDTESEAWKALLLPWHGSFCKVKYTWPSGSRAKIWVKCLFGDRKSELASPWQVAPRRWLDYTKIHNKAFDRLAIPSLGTKWVCLPESGQPGEAGFVNAQSQSVLSPEPSHTDLPPPPFLQDQGEIIQ